MKRLFSHINFYKYLTGIVCILILTIFSFFPSFETDFVGRDYNIIHQIQKNGFSLNYYDFIQNEKHVKELKDAGRIPYFTQSGVKQNFFRPISSIFAYFEYKIFKNNAFAYRIFNFALFLFAVFIFFVVLSNFLHKPQALIGAIIFIFGKTHYSLMKSVFIQDDLLVFIFIFVALFYFYKYFNERRKKQLYLSLIFCVLSLLTKETGIFSIIFILAYDTVFIRTGKLRQRFVKCIVKNYLYMAILFVYLIFYFSAGFGAYSLKYISILMPFKYLVYMPKNVIMDLYSLFLFIPQRGFSPNPLTGFVTLNLVSAFLCFLIIFAVFYNFKKNWRIHFFSFVLIAPILLFVGANPSETRLFLPVAGFSAIAGILLNDFFKNRSKNLLARQTMLIASILISLLTLVSPFYNNYRLKKYKAVSQKYKTTKVQLKNVLGDTFLSWRKILLVLNHRDPEILQGFQSCLVLELNADKLKYHILNPNRYVKMLRENENTIVLESYNEYGDYFIGNKSVYETTFLLDYNFKKGMEFDTKYYTVKILKLKQGKPIQIEILTKSPLADEENLFVRFNSLSQKYEIKRFTKKGAFR